jgi:hypothetical protein
MHKKMWSLRKKIQQFLVLVFLEAAVTGDQITSAAA